ncbi:MAG: hypothetical protein HYV35_05970 [Lentisphaerae bacterium]|nr:hypothetical protein [Lentisphaerota bacterium]
MLSFPPRVKARDKLQRESSIACSATGQGYFWIPDQVGNDNQPSRLTGYA